MSFQWFQHFARYAPGVWAMDPDRLAALLEFARTAARWPDPGADFAARIEAATSARATRRGGAVARIPITGPIEPKATLWSLFFGGTGLDLLQAEFDAAMADAEVKAIVFDVDSPGGSVYGVPEMARHIRAARGTKPLVAVANAEAASAAYYLASQADEVWVTPSGQVGSIGVVYVHTDMTGLAEKQGVSFRIFRSEERKADVNPFEPLSDEAAADIQTKVGSYHQMFVRDVARGRGVSTDTVRSNYGQGRMLLAADAQKAGLVDQVGTIEEAVARAASGRVVARQAAEAAEDRRPVEQQPAVDPVRLARLWDMELAAVRRGG